MRNLSLWILAACIAATPAAAAIRQIEVPPSRQQGLDMILIDEEDMPEEPELARHRQAVSETCDAVAVDPAGPVHTIYTDLRRQLDRYRERWSGLPQVRIADENRVISGTADPRVGILRQRLGLSRAGGLDKTLRDKLIEYQRAHGLRDDGRAGPETLASLNRGASHYERLILLNMERARRLPTSEFKGKYILVDAGSARLWLYENGRAVDSMKVIVGAPASETPMLAALMRYSSVNPYWNVPQDLARSLIAPRVLAQGPSYLSERGYQVLDGWYEGAPLLDPAKVDWRAVASGDADLRVRQLPGGANSMGEIKFMMPNEYGIYLHDTPNKALFQEEDRWVSNGCIRVEDARRLARWLHGEMPKAASSNREERVPLPEGVPVYVTYFTVSSEGKGLAFRADRYQRDAPLLARFPAKAESMIDPDEQFRRAMAL